MIRRFVTQTLSLASAAALALLTASPATAQYDHTINVGANYTYVRTNLVPGCDCFNMNGGGAQFEYGLRPHLSAIGDFAATHQGDITPDHYALTQFTFAGGVRYRLLPERARLNPFGDVLLGAAHTTGSLSPGSTGYGTSTAFSFQTGGGIAFRLSHRLTLVPVQADYLLTTFSNGASNKQNDLRLSAGVLFRLR
jgi:outer membrane immunogenic protein